MKKATMMIAMLVTMTMAILPDGYLTDNTPANTNLYIHSYFTLESGGVILILDKGFKYNNLNANRNNIVYIPHNLAGSKTIIATAMAAYLNGKQIGLFASKVDDAPHWGSDYQIPYIARLWMVN